METLKTCTIYSHFILIQKSERAPGIQRPQVGTLLKQSFKTLLPDLYTRFQGEFASSLVHSLPRLSVWPPSYIMVVVKRILTLQMLSSLNAAPISMEEDPSTSPEDA